MRVDPLFHPVEEGGPGVRPEGGGHLFHLLRPACGTGRLLLPGFHETLEEMLAADEAFLTGTAAEITPIREIDNKKIGVGKPGPVTQKLQQLFFATVKGEEPRYSHWLTYL